MEIDAPKSTRTALADMPFDSLRALKLPKTPKHSQTSATECAQSVERESHKELLGVRAKLREAERQIRVLERKLSRMSELVCEDQLTGSLNRRGIEDVFVRELARADRRKTPLSLAIIDIDDFKKLNDTYGHSVGDQVLVHLVKVVKKALRTTDVIARFGGEEFLILMPDTNAEDAAMVVSRLQNQLREQPFPCNGKQLIVRFSAGVTLRAPKENHATVLARADAALYRGKKSGKNKVVVST